MAQKFLYIVQHYVPFPASEYGGVWNVIAEDDDECFDLISAEDDGNFYEKYYSDLKENILNAVTFALAENVDSEVVESFTT
jgi:hypothetical protein